jgi:hypothetical protein
LTASGFDPPTVHTDNPTGAVGLNQKMGFAITDADERVALLSR